MLMSDKLLGYPVAGWESGTPCQGHLRWFVGLGALLTTDKRCKQAKLHLGLPVKQTAASCDSSAVAAA
jgi:hypothetical protein